MLVGVVHVYIVIVRRLFIYCISAFGEFYDFWGFL